MPNQRSNGFRLKGQKHLFTWSRIQENGFTTEDERDALREEWVAAIEERIQAEGRRIKYGALAIEKHTDGTPHVHAVLVVEPSWDNRRVDIMDIFGRHPNIETLATKADVERAITYLEKDDPKVHYWNKNRLPRNTQRVTYGEILDEATDGESFMSLMRQNQPREFVLSYERLEYFVRKNYAPPVSVYEPKYTSDDFPHVTAEMHEWVNEWVLSDNVCFSS